MEFFQTISGSVYHIENVIDQLYDFSRNNSKDCYELIIGSDSQRHNHETKYVSVVFLYNIDKRKFKLFFNKHKVSHTGHIDLSTRIINETLRSIEIYDKIKDSKISSLENIVNIEIHIDAGMNGNSKKVIPVCAGMVKGAGLEYKVKPDSWVASHVADRFSK